MKLVVRENELEIIYEDEKKPKIIPCAIGKNGKTPEADKVEGDGKTPEGIYELLKVYYRKDKIGEIETDLPKEEIQKSHCWSDDVDKEYNKMVELPFEGSCEEFWRGDDVYDIVITLSHNNIPIVSGKGSAIFFHIAKVDYSPTEGCVAILKEDMLKLLPDLGKDTKIEIL